MMVKNLSKIPKKVLLCFVKKNPNYENLKNKSQKDLVNIIIESDIICDWDYDSYSKCPDVFLKQLCKEKKEKLKEENKSSYRGVLKNKETMIEFLLSDSNDIVNYDINYESLIPKIKQCFESLEDLDISSEEIKSMF